MLGPTLHELGVRGDSLTVKEKKFLDEQGFLNLGKLMSDDYLEQVRNRIEDLLQSEGERAGSELMDSPYIRHPKEAGADRLADLVNKGWVFDQFYTHPRVLAAVHQVIGQEFKLSSLNYRAAKPGTGEQKLHVDWHESVEPGSYRVCNSIWLLDDFSEENGATRIVPGTHLTGELPQNVLADPLDPHPDQVLIEAPAGSVVIFNSHCWHGGTKNLTKSHRRAIHSYFCRADMPQQIDQKRYIQTETRDRLSTSAQKILGI